MFPVALFTKDSVYKLEGPGNHLSDVANWGPKLELMGGKNTAYWPNYPTRLDKKVNKKCHLKSKEMTQSENQKEFRL